MPADYTVRRGDTLAGIAKKLLGDAGRYKDLAALNNIKDANRILCGQKLKLPPAAATGAKPLLGPPRPTSGFVGPPRPTAGGVVATPPAQPAAWANWPALEIGHAPVKLKLPAEKTLYDTGPGPVRVEAGLSGELVWQRPGPAPDSIFSDSGMAGYSREQTLWAADATHQLLAEMGFNWEVGKDPSAAFRLVATSKWYNFGLELTSDKRGVKVTSDPRPVSFTAKDGTIVSGSVGAWVRVTCDPPQFNLAAVRVKLPTLVIKPADLVAFAALLTSAVGVAYVLVTLATLLGRMATATYGSVLFIVVPDQHPTGLPRAI